MYFSYQMFFIGLIVFDLVNSLVINHSVLSSLQVKQLKITTHTLLNAGVTLYGSEQTRSPLINWYLLEKHIAFTQKPSRPSKHPFGQIPFLTDESENENVEIFESGAILLYLADKYDNYKTPADRATYTKWVVWANSELDGLCFGNMKLDQPNVRPLDTLEKILSTPDYLVNNSFSVADVAIASYLNYVPIFYRNVNISLRPNIVRYMQRNAQRECYAKAFGNEHTQLILTKTEEWLKKQDSKGFFGR